MTTFMESLENQQMQETENGALGYVTTGSKLLDLNFAVPSFRKNISMKYYDFFNESIQKNPNLTLRWLLFLRDIKEGMGERDSYRNFLYYLCEIEPDLAEAFIEEVDLAEYGRWDDYIALYSYLSKSFLRDTIVEKLKKQLNEDVVNLMQGKPISLLAKWMPSEKASSKTARKLAKIFAKEFNLSLQDYRKTLSSLRKHLNIVEVKMSANKWDKIEYEKVTSGANLRYNEAFYKHDQERRKEYLESLEKGETKINANTLFLYDIVHKYSQGYFIKELDETLEALWKAQEPPKEFANTLVVRDGSGSMFCQIGKSNVTAIDVANALTIYLSEHNSEEFKDKFITFSHDAKLVNLSRFNNLHDKLVRLESFSDYTNTNVENVLSLVLRAMKKSNKSVDRLLFISDQEYDSATSGRTDKALFEIWQEKYKEEGFTIPKLVFWNVDSRTNTIPVKENENGVILVSGFSKNIVDMVMSKELDPYKILVDKLMTERYNIVDRVIIG